MERTDKSKSLRNLEPFYLILAGKFVPNKISEFRSNRVLTLRPKLGDFSKCSKYSFVVALLLSLKKVTAIVFIWGDRRYTKRPLNNIWLLRYDENSFGCCVYISATKYRSKAAFYSKRTAGYSLSPHIKTIAVASLQAE